MADDNRDGNDGSPRMNRANIFGRSRDEKPRQHVPKDEKKTIQEIGLPVEKRLTGKSKGIIINNSFKGIKGQELLGYEKDEINIVQTFNELNVDFHIERNLTANKMKNEIYYWVKETDFAQADSSFCFILTHGGDDGVLYGEDSKTIQMEEIKTMFINNKGLAGKPKLFFVQACRGVKDSEAVVISDEHIKKAAATVKKAKDAEVFQFYPTAPGKVSWVGKNGSMFITTLCNVVQAYGGKYTLQDIVTKVNQTLSHDIRSIRENNAVTTVCEASETTHSLTYNLYLSDPNCDANTSAEL